VTLSTTAAQTNFTAEQTCFRLLSSGTTGHARGVDISHRAQFARFHDTVDFSSGNPSQGSASLHIDQHQVSALINHLGATAGLVSSYTTRQQTEAELVDLVKRFETAKVMFNPKMLEEVLSIPGDDTKDSKAL
jgi:acyl-CoA synthetase (AMP-forming)/AMP-acid ligase II